MIVEPALTTTHSYWLTTFHWPNVVLNRIRTFQKWNQYVKITSPFSIASFIKSIFSKFRCEEPSLYFGLLARFTFFLITVGAESDLIDASKKLKNIQQQIKNAVQKALIVRTLAYDPKFQSMEVDVLDRFLYGAID